MGFLSIFLFFMGFFSFLKKQKHLTLFVIVLLSSSYFNLVDVNFLLGSISIQHGDLALLLIFILVLVRNKHSPKEFKVIKKSLLLFFIFLIISISYDVLFRDTSLIQVFRTTREIGYLMFFFLIYSFSYRDYQRLFNFLIIVTAVHAIFYISQYIFNYSYTPKADLERVMITNELGGSRYANSPFYLIPVFIICLFSYSKEKKYGLLVILFSLSILLAQSRGNIISLITIILLYLYFQKNIKPIGVIITSIFTYAIYLLILSYFPIIIERFSSLSNDIDFIGQIDYNNLQELYHQGSVLFRYGLTYERFMYVIDDPIRIIFGVGYVPDIEILNPIFTLGTYSPLLPTGFEQFNSADVFLPNIITRFGIVGSILFLNIIFKPIIYGFKNKNCFWGKILFSFLISLCFISFSSDTFYKEKIFLIIFMFLANVFHEKNNNKSLIN